MLDDYDFYACKLRQYSRPLRYFDTDKKCEDCLYWNNERACIKWRECVIPFSEWERVMKNGLGGR